MGSAFATLRQKKYSNNLFGLLSLCAVTTSLFMFVEVESLLYRPSNLHRSITLRISIPTVLVHNNISIPATYLKRSMQNYNRKFKAKLEAILQSRSHESWRKVIMVAICITIVVANFQMGPPVNLMLIANSTNVSKSARPLVSAAVDLSPREQRLLNVENIDYHSHQSD